MLWIGFAGSLGVFVYGVHASIAFGMPKTPAEIAWLVDGGNGSLEVV